MLAVVADDITGAAEIAGIGLRFGLRVSLITQAENSLPECDLLVYATDTRSFSEEEAIVVTKEVVGKLLKYGCKHFYKKTDSALRGYIVPELHALLEETGSENALLIPQNPSKGRIIRNGNYLIKDVPLNKTVFADDPEFPAKTSDVKVRLQNVTLVNAIAEITGKGIFVANATNIDEISSYLRGNYASIIFAGGADFFIEYLRSKGEKENSEPITFEGLDNRNSIIVCGSTASRSLSEYAYFERNPVVFSNMPTSVFKGGDAETWIEELSRSYSQNNSIVLTIDYPSEGGKNFALRLRNTMAEVTARLIDIRLPQELIIEGGATAFAIMNMTGWANFHLVNEIEPGVVRMSLEDNPQVFVTLKPGSYDWGENIFQ